MPHHDKQTSRDPFVQGPGGKLVQELYHLAETLHAPTKGPAQRQASIRLAEILKGDKMDKPAHPADPDRLETDARIDRQTQHQWVLDVLRDLAAYAEDRNLDDLKHMLQDAHDVAAQMLDDG
ncbi:hypothetical protein ACFMPD_07610 [Sedimentitalea sp. HM32M-2]|uniref:hypothetical protein n=1 Tax=Sedimentitalea sp. HM32M-2 TaxID=3351566 RepID=UPI0036340E1C